MTQASNTDTAADAGNNGQSNPKRRTRRATKAQTPSNKPLRRDFYKTLIVASNGSVVSPDQLKGAKVSAKPGTRQFNKQLRQAGFGQTRIFDSEGYVKARDTHRTSTKANRGKVKSDMIAGAFKAAGQKPHPRVESMLKTVLPLGKGIPEKRVERTLRNIVAVVASGFKLKTVKRGGRRGKKDQAVAPDQGKESAKQDDQATLH